MADQNWLDEKEVIKVIEISALVSTTNVELIKNLTKNMNDLLEKRGVKLLSIPKEKSLEERVGDLESLSAFTNSVYRQVVEAKEKMFKKILSQCTGKPVEEIGEEDAKKVTLVSKVGITDQEEFMFENKHIGTMVYSQQGFKSTIKFIPLKKS